MPSQRRLPWSALLLSALFWGTAPAARAEGQLDAAAPALDGKPVAAEHARPEGGAAAHGSAGGLHPFARPPRVSGTLGSSFVHGAFVSTGTIVAAAQTYSTLQNGVHLRAGRFLRHRLFVAGDVELSGGAGPAVGADRFVFNAGAALGMLWAVHPRLSLLPSLGLSYGLLSVGHTPGIDVAVENGLLLDLRLGLLSALNERISLLVAPVLQPTLVHSGRGVMEGAHVNLGLHAGVVCWF